MKITDSYKGKKAECYLYILFAIIIIILVGVVLCPSVFYDQWIWKYYWGPVVADAGPVLEDTYPVVIDEINGTILLTNRGKVIYSSYNKLDLKNFLKEVEFRVKIYNNSILKLFYTLKDNRFIFSEYVQNQYFIILAFDSYVKFGMAEHYLTRIVNSVKKILLD